MLPLYTPLAGLATALLSIGYAPLLTARWTCQDQVKSGVVLAGYPCKGSFMQQVGILLAWIFR